MDVFLTSVLWIVPIVALLFAMVWFINGGLLARPDDGEFVSGEPTRRERLQDLDRQLASGEISRAEYERQQLDID